MRIIESIIDFQVLPLEIFISLIYNTWAIGPFFDRKKKINYFKGFLSYLFGIITSLILLCRNRYIIKITAANTVYNLPLVISLFA